MGRRVVTVGVLGLIVGCYVGPDEAMDTEAADATTDASGDASASSSASSASASGSASTSSSGSASTSSSGSASSTDTGPTTTGASTTDATSDGETMDDGSTGGMTVADCSALEVELIGLVNAYRGENGLPPIPASPSLCIVGHTHAEDLAINAPHDAPGCNLHSWSNAGPWSPCCYTADHAQAQCMWDKPSELTVYPGYGYENAAGGGGNISPQQALDLWKNSPGHNAVILNQGVWADMPWGALGAGIDQGYAVLWFGEEPDPRR